MNYRWSCVFAALMLTGISLGHAASIGDDFSLWLKDPQFKAKYTALMAKTPVKGTSSWAFKDAKLATNKSFSGQNANTWVQLSTCALPIRSHCRNNHIDVFYDPENTQIFAFLTLGNRPGWIGKPMLSEQAFFAPHLTAKTLAR